MAGSLLHPRLFNNNYRRLLILIWISLYDFQSLRPNSTVRSGNKLYSSLGNFNRNHLYLRRCLFANHSLQNLRQVPNIFVINNLPLSNRLLVILLRDASYIIIWWILTHNLVRRRISFRFLWFWTFLIHIWRLIINDLLSIYSKFLLSFIHY